MAAPPSGGPTAGLPEIAALRGDLDDAGYTVDGVEALLGTVATGAFRRGQAVPARRELRSRLEPAATLARAFLLGEPVRRRALDGALPRLGADGAARCGLVHAAGAGADDEVRALVDLTPYAAEDAAGPVSWWLASDVGQLASPGPLPGDHVLGVGGASTTLAQLTVREPVARVLDIGTGCGVQALHAARHAGAVVATDVSDRALTFARFNAGLAGVGLDLRLGSLLEPVVGERFDLVVSNPPFVITPRWAGAALPRYAYRDGGRSGDDLVRDLITGVADVLEPGGVAQLLGNWEHRRGEGWRDRVESWLAGSGLDGWVVEREVADPAEYADTWLRDGGLTAGGDPADWRAGYEAWLADFEARGVEAVGFGYVTLRRPTSGAASLRRVEHHAGPVRQPLGSFVAATLRAHDWLAGTDDVALAQARLVVAPDVTEERYLTPGDADPRVVLLRQGGGLGRAVQADTALAGLVGACDGELTVAQIVGALAILVDFPAADLATALLPAVRELVLDGLLLPPGR